jgi:hypothetical protein
LLASPGGRCTLRRRCRGVARRGAGAAAGPDGMCNAEFKRTVMSSTLPSALMARRRPCCE